MSKKTDSTPEQPNLNLLNKTVEDEHEKALHDHSVEPIDLQLRKLNKRINQLEELIQSTLKSMTAWS